MPDIIVLTGNLNYTITLDPSSWLFDDRKFELDNYFAEPHNLDEPPRKFKKRELLKEEYTFAIPFKPFLENAQPKSDSKKLIIETEDGNQHEIALETAKKSFMAFTKEGKFLKEDGPAHFYYGDGSNRKTPITNITKFTVI